MLKLATFFNFCSQNYTSTFKIRSRLSQFLKHVHPDQLTQAPVKVKEQNLRSLTNFNSYIDSLGQSKPIQAKLLKFYIAQKNNMKSKKFFSFTIQLPQVTIRGGDMNEDKTKKLVDNIVEVLNKKFQQSKNLKIKHGKVVQKDAQKIKGIQIQDTQTQEQRIDRMSSTIKPFNRKQGMSEQQANFLKSALNNKYMQAQKQTLSTKLRQRISFANTGTNKPMMWSRIASQQSGIYQDYQQIMDQLIDPRLIYFDQALSLDEIQEFKKRLLPGALDRQSYRNSKIITQVCAKMQSFQPPICFYVTSKYSSTEIPGFMSIPYNFKAHQLAAFFQKQINTILNQKQKYQQYYDYYQDLRSQLQQQNNFIVDQGNFKNNADIWDRILMLKRLQKYKINKKIGLIAFQQNTFDVFKAKYQISSEKSVVRYNSKIIMKIGFFDIQLESIVQEINNEVQ